jgi:hypothetical protein
MVPSGYEFKHAPRPANRKGGGVGLLYKSAIKVKIHDSSKSGEYTHFEYMDCDLTTDNTSLRLAVVYRPRPTRENGFKNAVFFDQWSTFLAGYVTHSKEIIIVGDLNFHVDIESDCDARHFSDTLNTCGLQQHVHEPTHVLGHTLDVVICRDSSNVVSNITVTDPGLCNNDGKLIKDHFAVCFTTTLLKPAPICKKVSFRKIRAINTDTFKADIMDSPQLCSTSGSVEDLVTAYNNGLLSLIDKHAPLRTKTIILRPNNPWYNDDLHEAKHLRRCLERKWRKSHLTVHHQLYREQCVKVNKLLTQTRTTYYSKKITECGKDQRAIYKMAKHLLGDKGCPSLPKMDSANELAERFSTFFINKIVTLRDGLQSSQLSADSVQPSVPNLQVKTPLQEFTEVQQKNVEDIIRKSPSKSCELDPAPTWLVKVCIKELLPLITAIINASLTSSTVPQAFKCAQIKPLLKKMGLDLDILKNYRPVSNLPFLSKVLEKVVDAQLSEHLVMNELHEQLQSAYRKSHSTETALLKVQEDILQALDKGFVVVLIMLDLSAAFDTLDHDTLLKRFECHFGISGAALKWIESYLKNRFQTVNIEGEHSTPVQLQYGVPQGSVLGPKMYTMYTKPLGDLIQNHGLLYHFYADDTQLYVSFKANDDTSKYQALEKIENCLVDIETWMHTNMLKLNNDKTEIMLFLSKHNMKHLKEVSVKVGNSEITSSTSVRNLGVMFDCTLSMEQQVNNICRSAFCQLRNISHIRKYLTMETTKTLMNGLVLSRLDYCNSLFGGLPKSTLTKLQRVLNTAARVVAKIPRHGHITPALKELHWLPIQYRVQFKILMHTYKCIHGLAPTYMSEMITMYQPKRTLRSAEFLILDVPKVKSATYGDRQFKYQAAKLWNSLPPNIRQARTLETFKKLLKTHFFIIEYGV